MNNYIDKSTFLYLRSLIIPYNLRFLIVNQNNVLFDTRQKDDKLNKEFTLYLKDIKNQIQINEKKYLNIFENEKSNISILSALVIPLKDLESKICCYILVVNNNSFFDNISIDFFNSIKIFLENKFEFPKKVNTFTDSKKIKQYQEIKKQLYLDKNYLNINSLLIYNLNILYDNIEEENLAILNKIMDLEEQKNELTTIYSIEISSKYNNN